jgi:hypothetical protein
VRRLHLSQLWLTLPGSSSFFSVVKIILAGKMLSALQFKLIWICSYDNATGKWYADKRKLTMAWEIKNARGCRGSSVIRQGCKRPQGIFVGQRL